MDPKFLPEREMQDAGMNIRMGSHSSILNSFESKVATGVGELGQAPQLGISPSVRSIFGIEREGAHPSLPE